MSLTIERLKEVLHYDQVTGVFTWLKTISSRAVKGRVAGTFDKKGYRLINIDGKSYKAHRLAWLFVNGEWPPDLIDHINGNKPDNKIANLRLANVSQNGQNKVTILPGNKSGYLGVFWNKQQCKWQAQIKINGKAKHLGLFDDPEIGHQAYIAAKKELHPFYVQ